MPATFNWTLRYGSSASNKVVCAPGGTYQGETKESGMGAAGALDRIDFLAIDTGESTGGTGAVRINYYDYPIRAGENSMERWTRGKWDFQAGVTNQISGVKFWLSSPTGAQALADSVRIHVKVTGTYATPTGGAADGIIGADASGNLLKAGNASSPPAGATDVTFHTGATAMTTGLDPSGGYSDYIVLQLRTETSASPGNTNGGNPYQFTIQYDES